MNKIQSLINQHCPNGVPFKKLGEVCKRNSGTNITAAIMKELHKKGAPVRIFAGGSTFADVDYADVPAKDIIKETSIIVKSRGYIGFEYYENPFSHKNEFWSYVSKSDEINLKFIWYYLVNQQKYFQDKAKATSVKIPQLCVADTDNYEIPLPPLPVQKEIVSILDKFTELEAKLEAELAAELAARKKQYEYYRCKLLTFNEMGGGKWLILKEICKVMRGKRLTKSQLMDSEKYPVYHGGLEPLGYYGQSNRKANTVMVINVGASAGTVGYSDVDFWSSDGCFCIEHSDSLNSRYLFYFLLGQENLLRSRVRKAGIPTLDNSVVEQIKIPLPPLAEQNRIVAILDKFDALVNDISAGLPAEIRMRRQQYEYYRNKLLTFNKTV